MITKMQVEHYQQKIKDMLKPQIEIVKLSLQDKIDIFTKMQNLYLVGEEKASK